MPISTKFYQGQKDYIEKLNELDDSVANFLTGGSTFEDSFFTIKNNADPTKLAKFSLTPLTSGTTRTYTLPNVTGTLATLGNVSQTFTGATTVSGSFTASGAATFSNTLTASSTTITLGNSTATSTIDIGTGATVSGATKTVNIGTNGVSGSTSVVNLGVSAGTFNISSDTTVGVGNRALPLMLRRSSASSHQVSLGLETTDGTTTHTRYLGLHNGALKLGTSSDLATTGATVWTSGNDGVGSGLDADMLEGLHASSSNTASTIVSRDASGNFSAGTITASLTGNASTASSAAKLTTARTINGVSFDGTANITVADNTKLPTTGGTLSGDLTVNHANGSVMLQASNGGIEVNSTGGGAYIDFKDSGAEDYDVKLQAVAGGLDLSTPTGPAILNARLVHSGNYFHIKPYSAGYDDGSKWESYWDGNSSKLKTYRRNSDNSAATSFIESNIITGSLGTAATPAVQMFNDPDTGIYSAAANNVNIATGGLLAVSVQSDQNVNFSKHVGLADAAPSPHAGIAYTKTFTPNGTRYGGGLFQSTIDSSESITSNRAWFGIYARAVSDASSATVGANTATLYGGYFEAKLATTTGDSAFATTIMGSHSLVQNSAGAGTAPTAVYAAYNRIINSNALNVTAVMGAYNHLQNSSTYTGTLTTGYGTYNRLDQDAGTFSTAYGMYNSFEGTIATRWGIYSSGDAQNYLTGWLSLGESNVATVGSNKLYVSGDAKITGAGTVNGTFTIDASGIAPFVVKRTVAGGTAQNASIQYTTTDGTTTHNGYLGLAAGKLKFGATSDLINQGSHVLHTGNFTSGFRNKLLNGAMSIWQRGTSFSGIAAYGYSADQWRMDYNGSGNRNITIQSMAMGDMSAGGCSTFLRLQQTVAGSGGTFNCLTQNIEDVALYSGKTITISFYAKAAAALTMPNIVIQQYFGLGGSPSTTVDVNVASSVAVTTSWTRYVFTVTLPSVSGKVKGTSGDCLVLMLNVPINTTYTFDVTGVQLEEGDFATPFEHRHPGVELALCQRYYEVVPIYHRAQCSAGSQTNGISYSYKVSKRAIPTTSLNIAYVNSSNAQAFDLTVNGGTVRADVGSNGDSIINGTLTAVAVL